MFSVIIPTYNRALLMQRAVNSVLNQTFRDFEIIIVDDGSTDSTSEILKEYSDGRIKVIRHEKNRGVSSAKNTGLSKAGHEWFTILDSDDEMVPCALERFKDVILSHPGIEVITCNTVSKPSNEPGGYGWSEEGEIDSSVVLKYLYGEHWGVIKTSLIGNNRINEDLDAFEEVFWTKITWNKRRYFIIDSLRIYYTEGNDRVSVKGYYSDNKRYKQFKTLLNEEEYLDLLKKNSLKKYNQYISDAFISFLKVKDYRSAGNLFRKLNLRYISCRKILKMLFHLSIRKAGKGILFQL